MTASASGAVSSPSAVSSPGPVSGSDVELIRRLTHEYVSALDGGRLDDLVSLFTEDGVWDGTGWGIPAVQGSAALRGFFESTMSSNRGTCHLVLNHIIDVEGNSATGTAYFHAFGRRLDGSLQDSLGLYSDVFARTSRGWKFARRSVSGLLASPAAD
ncbi:nuclear transport factor 2 family protein [Arthrobacter sp. ATA002]|uniref:nuclear transport factor 2 family protein n=1 Tax=Arthrobacter sp. ATA002 TaxID=2991715 RepID=UPI0022A7558F|nr:nuclear transport factor 2 family protein [Arthrobacter sp. ATA002]WAP51320.1 nuclear transport factor 2 family protein [Arthrobacter sp. ATA002]